MSGELVMVMEGNASIELDNFAPGEFERGGINWWKYADPELLVRMQVFRERAGQALFISGHRRALGRRDGHSSQSMHNVDMHGMLYAADLMPENGAEPGEMRRLVVIARELFSGVGVYPDWSPMPGLHVDTRPSRRPGDPAVWGVLGGRVVSIEVALKALEG